MYTRIDVTLSEKYSIVPWGKKGMAILNGGHLRQVFNRLPTALEKLECGGGMGAGEGSRRANENRRAGGKVG